MGEASVHLLINGSRGDADAERGEQLLVLCAPDLENGGDIGISPTAGAVIMRASGTMATVFVLGMFPAMTTMAASHLHGHVHLHVHGHHHESQPIGGGIHDL